MVVVVVVVVVVESGLKVSGAKTAKREEVLPGIEPGLLESESKVITITLQNPRFTKALFLMFNIIKHYFDLST